MPSQFHVVIHSRTVLIMLVLLRIGFFRILVSWVPSARLPFDLLSMWPSELPLCNAVMASAMCKRVHQVTKGGSPLSAKQRSSAGWDFCAQEKSEEPGSAEGVKAEPAGRVRVPSRRVASPTNAAVHTGRAAPPNFAYHQGTSQYKGVSWSERSRKWRAQLWHDNKVCSFPASPLAQMHILALLLTDPCPASMARVCLP